MEGYYADLVVFDPGESFIVEQKDIASLCGWSPMLGQRFKGRVRDTIASGRLVVQDYAIASEPGDAMDLRFNVND